MMTIKHVGAALASLDFTAENERIAVLETQKIEIQAAIDRGEERRTEISRAMQRGDGPDGKAVASALLAGGDAQAAALLGPNREALEAEREALREGVRQLRYQLEDVQSKIDMTRLEPASAVAGAARPIIDQALDDVRETLSALPALFATLVAVYAAAGVGRAEIDALREVLQTARRNDLVRYNGQQHVPSDVVAALESLTGKGAVLDKVQITTSVHLP